jgi:superfamily II DNA or RNA helicase
MARKTEKYQDTAKDAIVGHLETSGRALLIAPTGAGKTATMGLVADELIRRSADGEPSPKIIILSHLRNLLRQTREEIQEWSGRPVGQFAARDDGGVDQSHDITVAMVQSASARLEELADYDYVFIDEAHHTKDGSLDEASSEDVAGHYDAVIRELESRPRADRAGLRILGVTATPYRGDEQGLDRRLQDAPRHVITYQEVIDSGRIVPIRTVRPNYTLSNGQRVEDFVAEKRADRNYDFQGRIAADLRRLRAKNHHDQAVDAWLDCARGARTICFVDDIKDGERLLAAFRKKLGEDKGKRVALIASSLSKTHNNECTRKYRDRDGVDILINCQMVGEGYDVRDTEVILCTRGSSSRSWLAQMGGRAMRQDATGRKAPALFIDMGASSLVLGALEEQIRLQGIESDMEKARMKGDQALLLKEFWYRPNPRSRVHVLPLPKETYFAFENGGGTYELFKTQHDLGPRSKDNSKVDRVVRVELKDEAGAGRPARIEDLTALARDKLSENFSWHAAMRSQAGETAAMDRKNGSLWGSLAQHRLAAAAGALELYTGQKIDLRQDSSFADRFLDDRGTKRDPWKKKATRLIGLGVAGNGQAIEALEKELRKVAARPDGREKIAYAAGVLMGAAVDRLHPDRDRELRLACRVSALGLIGAHPGIDMQAKGKPSLPQIGRDLVAKMDALDNDRFARIKAVGRVLADRCLEAARATPNRARAKEAMAPSLGA